MSRDCILRCTTSLMGLKIDKVLPDHDYRNDNRMWRNEFIVAGPRIGELDLDDEDKAIFSSKKRGL